MRSLHRAIYPPNVFQFACTGKWTRTTRLRCPYAPTPALYLHHHYTINKCSCQPSITLRCVGEMGVEPITSRLSDERSDQNELLPIESNLHFAYYSAILWIFDYERTLMKTCAYCNKPTTNPKYCSRSCAASAANKKPKRKRRLVYCAECGVSVKNDRYNRQKYCDSCRVKLLSISSRSLGYFRQRRKFNPFTSARQQARTILIASGIPQVCAVCGYDKHVEACHRVSLMSMPDDTLVSTANALTNLAFLCPNCHWELDNNLLTLTPYQSVALT